METKGEMTMTIRYLTSTAFLLYAIGVRANAASQLAPLYDALTKAPASAESMEIDLAKAVPSEELPIIIRALNSGSALLRTASLRDAMGIIGAHENDAQQNVNQLKPSLPELISMFSVLVPIVTSHFNDFEPDSFGSTVKEPYSDAHWKALVVRFVDLVGARPTPDMIAWMLDMFQPPENLGKKWVAQIESTSIIDPAQIQRDHDAVLRGMIDRFRAITLDLIPVLSHLNPMPTSVRAALMGSIDNNKEPEIAASVIDSLSYNKMVGSDIADRLIIRALDKDAPPEVRAASVYAVAKLQPLALRRFVVLRGDPDITIARALRDVGVR